MPRKPLVIDLCCGLGGWTRGFLAEGYDAVGFDIERHVYGDKRYPAQLVLQDITTLNGAQFRNSNALVIVASPPCQAYSYRAMPWKRAKALPPPDNTLFFACFRIAQEAGLPIVVENVCGAQKWVGRAKWHWGSFYLWGDVPALMPHTLKLMKRPGRNFHGYENGLGSSPSFNGAAHETRGVKGNGGGGWFSDLREDGTRPYWKESACITRMYNSKSDSRKAASAMIAEIPFDLAQHIARVFKPQQEVQRAS